jgi:hypothetical protein
VEHENEEACCYTSCTIATTQKPVHGLDAHPATGMQRHLLSVEEKFGFFGYREKMQKNVPEVTPSEFH